MSRITPPVIHYQNLKPWHVTMEHLKELDPEFFARWHKVLITPSEPEIRRSVVGATRAYYVFDLTKLDEWCAWHAEVMLGRNE